MASKFTEAPMSATSTPEYEAFRKNYSTIRDFIKEYRNDLCDDLYGEGCIDKDQRDSMQESGTTDRKALAIARKIVDYLLERVKDDPNYYHKLLQIISTKVPQDDRGKEVVQKIEDTCQNICKEQKQNLLIVSGISSGIGFQCPYCKKCTPDQFFSEGCPNKAEKGLFPYLNIAQMSKEEGERIKARLKHDTEVIILSFVNFCETFKKSLMERGVPLDDIKYSILSLKPFVDGIAIKLLDSDDEINIKKASTITEIFTTLLNYVSFFNFRIIQQLVSHHGHDVDCKKLENYTRELHTFCQRSVFEVPSGIFSGSSRPTAKVIVLKCTQDLVDTLNDVRHYKDKVEEILKLDPVSLQLCSIQKGCVELHFLISNIVIDRVFPLSPVQITALDELGMRVFSLVDQLPKPSRKCKEEFMIPVDSSTLNTTSRKRTKCVSDQEQDDSYYRIGFWSSVINPKKLKLGDHIYVNRFAGIFLHHGIYAGVDDKGGHTAIHFTCCGRRSESPNIRKTSLDDFLKGGQLHLVAYNAGLLTAISRGGTVQSEKCTSAEQVMQTAQYYVLHPEEWEDYHVLWNNCEHFAVFCKTGKKFDHVSRSIPFLGALSGVKHSVIS